MRAQEELEEPQEATSATAFPKEQESGLRNCFPRHPTPRPAHPRHAPVLWGLDSREALI